MRKHWQPETNHCRFVLISKVTWPAHSLPLRDCCRKRRVRWDCPLNGSLIFTSTAADLEAAPSFMSTGSRIQLLHSCTHNYLLTVKYSCWRTGWQEWSWLTSFILQLLLNFTPLRFHVRTSKDKIAAWEKKNFFKSFYFSLNMNQSPFWSSASLLRKLITLKGNFND